MTDQVHEARELADSLLKSLANGPPSCWPANARLIAEAALHLAELTSELLPLLEVAVQDGVRDVIAAHEQINAMQHNLSTIGEGVN